MSTKSLWAVIAGIAVSALVLVPSSLPASDPEAASQAADSAFDLAVSYAGAHPAALGVGSADVLDLYATSTVKSAVIVPLPVPGPARSRSRGSSVKTVGV